MKIQSLEEAKKIRDELYQTAVDAFLDIHGFCPDEFLNEEESENFLEAEEYIEKHGQSYKIMKRGKVMFNKFIKNGIIIDLYYHKTDGGAEYLSDNFIDFNGHKEGCVNSDTKLLIRIDGNELEIIKEEI